MSNTITCPKCAYEIELTEALSAQLRQHLQQEFEADAQRKEQAFAEREQLLRDRERSLDEQVTQRIAQERQLIEADATTKAQQTVAVEVQDLKEQLQESTS